MAPRKSTLTGPELEIMKIVWRLEKATVRAVYEELLERRKIAYTTVMTVMRTLEQKGYLKSSQDERAYVYQPARPKNQVIKNTWNTTGMLGACQAVFNLLKTYRHLSGQLYQSCRKRPRPPPASHSRKNTFNRQAAAWR